MTTHKQLLERLLSQHNELRSILIDVSEEVEKDVLNPEWLLSELVLFRAGLDEHLKLEDDVFYPEVFKVLREQGNDTANTEKFVNEMKALGIVVYGYLDKYNSKEAIVKNSQEFKEDIQDMAAKILLRVSVEEQGVYLYLQ